MSATPPAGGSTPAPTTTPTTPVAPTTPPTTVPTNSFVPPVITSQQDLDDLFAGRATRAKQSERNAIATALGVPVDKLDQHLLDLKAAKEAGESASEKAIREAREQAAKDTETRLQAESAGTIGKAKTALIKSAIVTEAQALGFTHPEDVYLLLQADPAIKIDDDFKVDGVKKAVEKVATERPGWVGSAAPFRGSPPLGGGRPPAAKNGLDAALQERRDAMRQTGGVRGRNRL